MENNTNKIHSLLGLAMRAGKLVSGEDTTLMELKKNRLCLVIVADDASNNTKKLFNDKSSYRKVECICFSNKEGLGISIGKDSRAVVGIKDIGFAKKIKELMD